MENFKNQTCLGDRLTVIYRGSAYQGVATTLSERGVVMKDEKGSHFYKWCHVKKVEKHTEFKSGGNHHDQ